MTPETEILTKAIRPFYPFFYFFRESDQIKHTIAGAGAGLVTSVVTCPLDVVKTRLQNQGVSTPTGKSYKGTAGTQSLSSLKEQDQEQASAWVQTLTGPFLCCALCFSQPFRHPNPDLVRGGHSGTLSRIGTNDIRISANMGYLLYSI